MTIDVAQSARALALVLLVWFLGMAALALVVEPRVVTVFGPAAPLLADPSLRILAVRPGIVTVAGQSPGWVRRLYTQGALFVWPIPKGGCFTR
jgi:hypothetical protein